MLAGNFIGTNADGTVAIPNAVGIRVSGKLNMIGGTKVDVPGTCNGDCNLISGNTGEGVVIENNFLGGDSSERLATGNVVLGNFIGTDVTGTLALGNTSHGVRLRDLDLVVGRPTGNTIGGGADNLISGNRGDGVFFELLVNNNAVQNNLIGTNLTGTAAIPNAGSGVRMQGAQQNEVRGNVLSGNIGDGVRLQSGTDDSGLTSAADDNTFAENLIGTNAAGTAALPNGLRGVDIADSSNNNLIGNVVSGNLGGGIGIRGLGGTASSNHLVGNVIGTTASGDAALGNGNFGVQLEGNATLNNIGGTDPGENNVISANLGPGVALDGSNVTLNFVQGNRIGTDLAASVASPAELGNQGPGVLLNNAPANTVGDAPQTPSQCDGACNVISHNQVGVLVTGDLSVFNGIGGNFIGTDLSGTQSLGNIADGIRIENGTSNTIGSAPDGSGAGNLIGFNGRDGIFLVGTAATNNGIHGNAIGTDFSGTRSQPNQRHGVRIENASGNIVGTALDGSGARNLIAFNNSSGVAVVESLGGEATGNSILGNSIFENFGLGIDLGDDGFSANDAGDADTGPNNLQNFPIVTAVRTGSTIIEGMFNSASNGEFRLEFFEVGVFQGARAFFLGSVSVVTDSDGDAPFVAVLDPTVAPDSTILATATDADGNTSEFEVFLPPPPPPADLAITKQVDPDAVDVGQQLTYELSVTNLGPGAAAGVTVTDVLPSEVILLDVATDHGTCELNETTVTCDLGTLDVDEVATTMITVRADTAGSVTNTATVAAIPPDPDDTNNGNGTTDRVVLHLIDGGLGDSDRAADGVVTDPGAPAALQQLAPQIIDTRLVERRRKITRIDLVFDQDMDRASAENLVNYEVIGLGKVRRNGTRREKAIAVRDAVYDALDRVLSLVPKRSLPSGRDFRVTVSDAVTAADGTPLDGDGDGQPGGDHVLIGGLWRHIIYTDRDGDVVDLAIAPLLPRRLSLADLLGGDATRPAFGGRLELVRSADGEARSLRLLNTVAGRTVLAGRVTPSAIGTGITSLPLIDGVAGVRNDLPICSNALPTNCFQIGVIAAEVVDRLLAPIGP